MAKLTLTDLTSLANDSGATNKINTNNEAIELELQNNVLYRDNPQGEPNSMQNDLDMNSNDILNAGTINTGGLTIDGQPVSPSGVTYAGAVREVQTATAGQVLFTLGTFQYVIGTNTLSIFINGVRQIKAAYTEISGTQIQFSEGLDAGDVVEFQYFAPSSVSEVIANVSVQTLRTVATEGQTVFTTPAYNPGVNGLEIFLNGLRLDNGVDYIETSSGSVTLTSGATAGDVILTKTNDTLTTGDVDAAQVSYTPSGTGAVATNVQDKLRESVSVKDFGAVGDGVVDDTAAIQAALDSGAKNINTPTGSYNIAGTLTIPGDVTLYLDSGAQLMRYSTSANTDPVIRMNSAKAGLIGGGMLTSFVATQNACPDGIIKLGHDDLVTEGNNVTFCTISNLAILGSTDFGQTTGNPDVCLMAIGNGVNGKACYFNTIENVRVGSANIGVQLRFHFNGNSFHNIHGSQIGNVTLSTDQAMFYFEGCADNMLSNLFFHQSSGTTFLKFVDLNSTRTANNSFTNAICEQGGGGFPLDANANCTAISNVISGNFNTTSGINVYSTFLDANTVITQSYIRGEIIGGATGVHVGGFSANNLMTLYEEGTWTPSVANGTLTNAEGTYTRIGNIVHLRCSFENPSDQSSGATFLITGLPYEPDAKVFTGSILARYLAKNGELVPAIPAANHIRIHDTTSAAWTIKTYADFTNTLASVTICITYTTSA